MVDTALNWCTILDLNFLGTIVFIISSISESLFTSGSRFLSFVELISFKFDFKSWIYEKVAFADSRILSSDFVCIDSF